MVDGFVGKMFKFKSNQVSFIENNPIWQEYTASKQTPSATAGPEHVWRIFDAYKKSDLQEVSIFFFEKRSVEKFHKPKHKDNVTDLLRRCVKNLEEFHHPKVIQILSPLRECPETLAFATEPIIGSLANILAYKEQQAIAAAAALHPNSNYHVGHNNPQQNPPGHRPVMVKQYDMLAMEIKYGLLQIIEALGFLHCNAQVVHRNVCPSSIMVTKKGTWKLCGLEFIERINENGLDPHPCQPWTNKLSKILQPSLDYIAPEIQLRKHFSVRSDMFSLGMVIAAIYNDGKPFIQANHSNSEYLKQLESLNEHVEMILPRVPAALHEAVSRLLFKDPESRPIAKHLSLIKYFSDPSVHALQFLDVIAMKDPTQKAHFYKVTLKEGLPFIPLKLWYQHIWPCLELESKSQEVFAAVLHPMLYIVEHSHLNDYENVVLPTMREILKGPRSMQGTVLLLENLHIIFEKTPREIVDTEMIPVLFSSFDSPNIQVQAAAYHAVTKISDYLDDQTLKKVILPKLIGAFETNSADTRVLMNCLSIILDSMSTSQIVEEVYPLLWEIKITDGQAIFRVINIYRLLLSNVKYGLSVNLIATKVMPLLLPVTVNPNMDLKQFTELNKLLQDMMSRIERTQVNKLKLSMSSPERHRALRHQFSNENVHAPAFNIPGLRIDQRKTSSAENMDRKNSIGFDKSMTVSAENMTQRKNSMTGFLDNFWFRTSQSANDNTGFLRVNALPTRRLSDNTLLTPKIRIAPSCSSSPGGTPGGGLPIRRHSSTGPQERRGSNVNLSPPTGMPTTSSSVPYLLSSSMTSIRNSRRPSVSSTSSAQGAGLLQQFGNNMCQLFSGRS